MLQHLIYKNGTTDVKNPLKSFFDCSDFSIHCSKIATESLPQALQKGCLYTVTDWEIEVFIDVNYFIGNISSSERLLGN